MGEKLKSSEANRSFRRLKDIQDSCWGKPDRFATGGQRPAALASTQYFIHCIEPPAVQGNSRHGVIQIAEPVPFAQLCCYTGLWRFGAELASFKCPAEHG
jgi:hypothetical protein